jgi:hypothetical protein
MAIPIATIVYQGVEYEIVNSQRSLKNVATGEVIDSPKCNRTACDAHGCCVHTENGKLYCPRCARKINECNPGLVAFPKMNEPIEQRNLVVDGHNNEGLFAGDGELPPFVVFDVDQQENIAGPFDTRAKAETHRKEILAGATPNLDVAKISALLEQIDNDTR